MLAATSGASSIARSGPEKLRAIAPRPVWTLCVRALGYTAPAVREGGTHDPWVPGPLCFAGGSKAVVTFVGRTAPSALPRRGQPTSTLPLRLHALFIDAATGRSPVAREWPTGSYLSRVVPAPRGGFLVFTTEHLLLYTADSGLGRRLPLTLSVDAAKGTIAVSASPAGGYLLISYEPWSEAQRFEAFGRTLRGTSPVEAGERIGQYLDYNPPERRQVLVDVPSLRVTRSWIQKGAALFPSVADDGAMLKRGADGDLETRAPNGARHVFCAATRRRCSGPGEFVGDDALFSGMVDLGMRRRAMRLVLVDGSVIFEHELSEKQDVRYVATSAGGRRFAVAIDKGKGGSELLDIGAHYSLHRIFVYDLPTRRWVYALDCKKEGIKSISGLALSPDGTLLALINQDGILEVFRLPPEHDTN